MVSSPKYLFRSNSAVSVKDCIPMQPLFRPRRDSVEYQALYNSMQITGQKIPIKTRPHPDPTLREQGKLEVLDGMGRLEAANELGWTEIQADVEDLNDLDAYEMAFSLNLTRENLSAYAIAAALWFFKNTYNRTQTQLGEKFGRTQPWVSRHMALIQEDELIVGGLDFSQQPVTEREARALRNAPDHIREQAMQEAMAGAPPSARDIERRIKAEYTPEQVLARYVGKPRDDAFLEYTLQEKAGLTIGEAKERVAKFWTPKRSSTGKKYSPDTNAWERLSRLYPPEIIDVVAENLTPSENFEVLIKYCRRYVQKLFSGASSEVKQRVLTEWQ